MVIFCQQTKQLATDIATRYQKQNKEFDKILSPRIYVCLEANSLMLSEGTEVRLLSTVLLSTVLVLKLMISWVIGFI